MPAPQHLLVQQAPVRRRQEDVPQKTIVLVGLLDIFSIRTRLSAAEGGEVGGGLVGEVLLSQGRMTPLGGVRPR